MSEGNEGAAEADFEQALSELEDIVRSLDRRELDLDEALSLFERGVDRLRTATARLDDAEGRVEELIQEASGALSAVELEMESGTGEEDEG